MQIRISSIFPEGKDINLSISHAFDSIGLKETPKYEVKAIEEKEWVKRAQVNLIASFVHIFCFIVCSLVMFIRRQFMINAVLCCTKSTFPQPYSLCSAIYVWNFVIRGLLSLFSL